MEGDTQEAPHAVGADDTPVSVEQQAAEAVALPPPGPSAPTTDADLHPAHKLLDELHEFLQRFLDSEARPFVARMVADIKSIL